MIEITQSLQLAKECTELNNFERDLWAYVQANEGKRAEMPVEHFILGGMYVRTIFMPAGTALSSGIHRIFHSYFISKGGGFVWSQSKGWEAVSAPHHGFTLPGTRRGLYIMEDCVWTTFHPTTKTTVEEALLEVIEPHDTPVPDPDYKKGRMEALQ